MSQNVFPDFDFRTPEALDRSPVRIPVLSPRWPYGFEFLPFLQTLFAPETRLNFGGKVRYAGEWANILFRTMENILRQAPEDQPEALLELGKEYACFQLEIRCAEEFPYRILHSRLAVSGLSAKLRQMERETPGSLAAIVGAGDGEYQIWRFSKPGICPAQPLRLPGMFHLETDAWQRLYYAARQPLQRRERGIPAISSCGGVFSTPRGCVETRRTEPE